MVHVCSLEQPPQNLYVYIYICGVYYCKDYLIFRKGASLKKGSSVLKIAAIETLFNHSTCVHVAKA